MRRHNRTAKVPESSLGWHTRGPSMVPPALQGPRPASPRPLFPQDRHPEVNAIDSGTSNYTGATAVATTLKHRGTTGLIRRVVRLVPTMKCRIPAFTRTVAVMPLMIPSDMGCMSYRPIWYPLFIPNSAVGRPLLGTSSLLSTGCNVRENAPEPALSSGTSRRRTKTIRETVIISPLHGYFHLTCPFYALEPTRYRRSCLVFHSLRSIQDVISHLKQQHTQPAYCIVCGNTFSTTRIRDEHARRWTCGIARTGEDGGDGWPSICEAAETG
ncbi:hypothetical protein B0H66DRAFT_565525 [Apodospora peruviana]|uniref:Uncharacterized protein n=1 Tax=Apodospora peruviana TaxID=516989 RepID=A0AAE0M1G5_9PEZI|nr:hypothetical protein B0H66DRAFT_565525 [Apodospora peruviana]